MKTKDYVSKYQLNHGTTYLNKNSNEFIIDLTTDFMTLLEVGNGMKNIKGFENAVRAIKMKFDAINNKIVGNIENRWKYFYATVIIPYKYELFPEVMIQRDKEREERKRRREEYQRLFNEEFSFGFFEYFAFLGNILNSMLIPIKSFEILGLTSTATEDEIKRAYWKLSTIHHPDKGGNNEEFIKLTEAKNKCLLYLKSK